MDPEQVCRSLEWLKVFSREDREEVLRKAPTTSERNSCVMDRIMQRPNWERKLLEALRMTHPQLVSDDIPVVHRVVWLVASPSDAASVVSTVQESKRLEAVFGPVQTDRGFLFRSCLHFRHSNTIVTLAFPSSDTDEGMRIAVRNIAGKWSRSNLVVFSGPCASLEPLGHPWIVSDRSVGVGNLQQLLEHVHDLEGRNEAPWLDQLTDQRESLVRFFDQVVWLVRLHTEISQPVSSAWLSSIGWNVGRSLDDNMEALLRFVPDWNNPDFQDYLLKESRQWTRDDSHPLGVQPTPSLKEAVRRQEEMLRASRRPHDIPAAAVRVGKVASGGAIDDDTVCSSRVCVVADALDQSLPGVPRLVCLSSLTPMEEIVPEELRGLALQSCHDLCIECILRLTQDH